MSVKYKIAAYIYPRALKMPTGVSMLTLNMVRVLAKNPEVELRLLAGADELEPDGTLPPELKFDGLPVVPLPWRRGTREAVWLASGWPPVDRYLSEDFWVYSTMETYVPARRCRRIITVHHLESRVKAAPFSGPALRQWRQDFRLRKAIRTADLIVAQSTFTRDAVVREFSAPMERMQVVGSGVTEEYFQVPQNRNLDALVPDYAPFILCTGAMDHRKGTDYMLNLARLLWRRKSPVKIVCTAGLYGNQDYIATAQNLPNIVLLNFVSQAELLAYYQKAICLICLSRLEGFGLPLVEAMAAGLPVIAANNTAIPETLGGAGILVAPENTEQVAAKVDALQQDKDFRANHIFKGIERAKNYTWEACMKRMLAGIRQIEPKNH